MSRRPLIAKDHWDFGDAKLARGFESQVSINNLTVAAGEDRNLESELTNRSAHAIDGAIVLARVARIFDEPFYRPRFDVLRERWRSHD